VDEYTDNTAKFSLSNITLHILEDVMFL